MKAPWRAPPGELHELKVSWLGIPGLVVSFEVLPFEEMNRRKVYHVRASGETSGLVGLFYKLNNTVDSWFDYEKLHSLKLHLKQNQRSLKRDSLETYDPEKGETVFWNRWTGDDDKQQETKATFPMAVKYAQDSFSAFYYLRSLPLTVGHQATVPVVSEGKIIQVLTTVVRRERDWEIGDQTVSALVVRLQKLDDKGNPLPGDNFVWITDDERRILLKVDVKAKIGHVVASLKRFKRTKP